MIVGNVRLTDGRTVVLRRATAEDGAAVVRLFCRLSPESARRRFLGPRPSDAVLARYTGPEGGSVVAVSPGRPAAPPEVVAEARYVPVAAGTADLAMAVRDDHQGVGLGRGLLAATVHQARQDGVERLQADVLVDNTPMLRLVTGFGWVLGAPADGCTVSVVIATGDGMPGWGDLPPGTRKVLVEGGGWYEDARVRALRAAGTQVLRCLGPRRRADRSCALLVSGRCRVAQEADRIVTFLPAADPQTDAILAAHRRDRPPQPDPPRRGGGPEAEEEGNARPST